MAMPAHPSHPDTSPPRPHGAEDRPSATARLRAALTHAAHLLPAQDGWQRIADDVLDWALQHAGSQALA